MHVISWNIRSGGQGRAARIAEALRGHDPDLIVLGEYRSLGSRQLVRQLADDGWQHQVLTMPPERTGGLAVLSKRPIERLPSGPALEPFSSRFLMVSVPAAGLVVCGVYGLLHKEPFADYWVAVLDELERLADGAVLVVGDFNTGAPLADAPGRRFFCSQYFAQLPGRAYTDLWRLHHGADAREHTWQGRTHPYRLDHAFGTRQVVDRLQDCRYSHAERHDGVSDHSLVSVRLAGPREHASPHRPKYQHHGGS